jgi:aryl-alcohol dehydrogenase-like predicted oxidoreductase
MEKRKLGSTGYEVAPLAFGGNVFGWTVDEPTSFLLLDTFVDAGFNLIDTADSYSRWVPGHAGGESEAIIGRWIAKRGRHDDIVIATKIGSDMGLGYKCLRREYIMQGVEQSLKRLQVDSIDLYQSHWDDEATPLEETLEAHSRLIQQGKVKAIGASNLSAERLGQALNASRKHGFPCYATLQPHYNLYDRASYEGPLQELCIREGLGVIAYFSLAAGFLTGKYRSEKDFAKSQRGRGMQKYLNPRGVRILGALDEVAQRHGVKPAHVALSWVANRPGVTAPIASATSLAQLRELIAATRLSLGADSVRMLDKASAE